MDVSRVLKGKWVQECGFTSGIPLVGRGVTGHLSVTNDNRLDDMHAL